MRLAVFFIKVDCLQADFQDAAARHGVAGIDGKIHHDLLHHAAVAKDDGQFIRGTESQGNIFADQAVQHLGHVADDRAQVERLGLHGVSAAEHQQLPGEAGGAFSGEIGGLDRVADFLRQVRFGQEQTGVPLDDREHVVEIMRDARCELSDRFHLLRLPQLRLKVQPLGRFLNVAMDDAGREHRVK